MKTQLELKSSNRTNEQLKNKLYENIIVSSNSKNECNGKVLHKIKFSVKNKINKTIINLKPINNLNIKIWHQHQKQYW
jgi:hypothetical protein